MNEPVSSDQCDCMAYSGVHERAPGCREPRSKETKSLDLLDLLREELEKRVFVPGEHKGFEHIEYCSLCHYSREWITKHGHDESCLLGKRS